MALKKDLFSRTAFKKLIFVVQLWKIYFRRWRMLWLGNVLHDSATPTWKTTTEWNAASDLQHWSSHLDQIYILTSSNKPPLLIYNQRRQNEQLWFCSHTTFAHTDIQSRSSMLRTITPRRSWYLCIMSGSVSTSASAGFYCRGWVKHAAGKQRGCVMEPCGSVYLNCGIVTVKNDWR